MERLVKTNPIPYGPIFPMNNNICLALSRYTLSFPNGGNLLSVLGSDSFIAFPPNRPTVLIWHNVLVPGPGP